MPSSDLALPCHCHHALWSLPGRGRAWPWFVWRCLGECPLSSPWCWGEKRYLQPDTRLHASGLGTLSCLSQPVVPHLPMNVPTLCAVLMNKGVEELGVEPRACGHSGCSGPSCPFPRLGALELTLQSPAVLQTHVATILVLPPCSVLSVS